MDSEAFAAEVEGDDSIGQCCSSDDDAESSKEDSDFEFFEWGRKVHHFTGLWGAIVGGSVGVDDSWEESLGTLRVRLQSAAPVQTTNEGWRQPYGGGYVERAQSVGNQYRPGIGVE